MPMAQPYGSAAKPTSGRDDEMNGLWRLRWTAQGFDTAQFFPDPDARMVVWNRRFVSLFSQGIVILGGVRWVGEDAIDFEALGTAAASEKDMFFITQDGATRESQSYRGRLQVSRVGSKLIAEGDVQHGSLRFRVVLTKVGDFP